MSKKQNKRNKLIARAARQHASPYKKYGKRPCAHCQAVTVDSKRRAMRNEPITGGENVQA